MYLTFSNLNSVYWIIKKILAFMYFSGHFMTIFRSNYFHLKIFFTIYGNVFNIFIFELNPLDNKKDISLYVLFRTFQVNFQDISVTPTQQPKEKVQKDKQRSTKYTRKTKDRITQTPLKTGVN
jgi:hypothetical protein